MTNRRKLWIAGGAIVAVGLAILGQDLVLCERVSYIDRNTGSWYGYTKWFFGAKTGYRMTPSPLAEFVRTKDPKALVHRWSYTSGAGKNLFGHTILHSDGPSSGMVFLNSALQHKWMSLHPDAEVRAFYDFLCVADYDACETRVWKMRDELAAP